MVEKREEKHLYNEEALGIVGLTLGILSIIFLGAEGILPAIVGFFLCLYQQKKRPTRAGKIGLIINIIGFVLCVIFIIVSITYLMPFIQQLQTQTFPTA